MCAVVAFGLLVLSQYPSSRLSVDYFLEQRVTWWHRVAELGRHNHPATDRTRAAPDAGAAPLAPPKSATVDHTLSSRRGSFQPNAATRCNQTGRAGLAPGPPTMIMPVLSL